MPGLESRRLRRGPPAAAPGPRRGRRVRRGLGERGPDDAWRPCSIGIRTSLRCQWRAFRRVTVITVDRWNSGTAGRCSGNSLRRYNVVTLGAVTWYPGQPGLSAFSDEGGLVLGHQGEHPEHDGAVRGGGVDQSVAQRPDPDPAGLQGGDDVDEVAQVAAEPVDPPDDQGVARAQIGEAGRPLRPVGLRAAGPGLQLDALATEDCLKVHTDGAPGVINESPVVALD